MSLFFEDWAVSYGSPYLISPEETEEPEATLIEDGKKLRFHAGRDVSGLASKPGDASAMETATKTNGGLPPLAFVDGVRRGEASLYRHDPTTHEIVHGVAGAHACGAVISEGTAPLVFRDIRIRRLVIWGGGQKPELSPALGGFEWEADSILADSPKDLLKRLHDGMRTAEATLAEILGKKGYLTVIDGPLPYGRVIDAPILGYIKTHHKAQLAPMDHKRVPDLAPGERTSLFAKKDHCYSTYLRLAPRGAFSGPWAGIVRLEIPIGVGLKAAKQEADRAAFFLPRFAGIAHKDPRAPQNLQPIGALEGHLRHLLGDPRLAGRAVREAVTNNAGRRAFVNDAQ